MRQNKDSFKQKVNKFAINRSSFSFFFFFFFYAKGVLQTGEK